MISSKFKILIKNKIESNYVADFCKQVPNVLCVLVIRKEAFERGRDYKVEGFGSLIKAAAKVVF